VADLAGSGHPEVKRYLELRRRGRGAVAADGFWSLRRAVEVGAEVQAVFRCPELARGPEGAESVEGLEAAGVPAFEVSGRLAARMADRDGPDGIFAIVGLPRSDWSALPGERLLVLDGIESAGNLGTLLRLADATGAGVILSDCEVRLESPKVLHASMATMLHVPVVRATGDEARAWLREYEWQAVLADPDCPISYREAKYGSKVAVVLGSERYGLTGGWPAAISLAVSLPMLGRADSLNVGHAAAVLMYEVLAAQAP
jgi:RNA methyltransferase, TrmH family